MRRARSFWALFLLVVLLVGCGPSEPLIEKPAAEMNLTEADLGGEYTLQEEQGYTELTADMEPAVAAEVSDAHMRLFVSNKESAVVMGIVINIKSVSKARGNLSSLVDGFKEGLTESLTDVSYEEVEAPAMGDETIISKAAVSDPMLGGGEMHIYMVGVRKANVILVAATFGSEEISNEDAVRTLAQKMLDKAQ